MSFYADTSDQVIRKKKLGAPQITSKNRGMRCRSRSVSLGDEEGDDERTTSIDEEDEEW